MAKLKCPFCYAAIDGGKLWVQCAGRGSPGKAPCLKQKDPQLEQFTGNADPVLPSFPPQAGRRRRSGDDVCPQCGGRLGPKVCPNCHSRMPATFGEEYSPLIAMIGAKGTGKTVYLSVLTNELRRGMGGRFAADVAVVGDSPFRAGSGTTFTITGRGPIPDGALFAQTAQALKGRREPIVFAWRRKQRFGHGTTFLSFLDTAGEDLGSQQTVDDLRYLGAADALILLLDPFMIPEARDRIHLPPEATSRSDAEAIDVLYRVTDALRTAHRLGNRRNIRIPVAVVFAKIDAFFELLGPDNPLVRAPEAAPYYDEASGLATHEYVRALLYDWNAAGIDTHLSNNYKTFRYFAVSALGAEPDYANDRVDEHGLRPFRVDEPLLWLLSRDRVVPSGGMPR